jgi:HEPN domain-containing protein
MPAEDQWLTRDVCRQLAETRLSEARHLLEGGLGAGAYYLAGYAVELALKAVISRAFFAEAIPSPKFVRDIYSHDLESLINIARLRVELERECASNERFAANWFLVRDWSEQSRYELTQMDDARYLVEAIEHPTEGILTWIRNRW